MLTNAKTAVIAAQHSRGRFAVLLALMLAVGCRRRQAMLLPTV